MKILKIENGNAYFKPSIKEEWKPIDEIDKGGLMKILNVFLNSEVEIDTYDETQLQNQAQQIIYKSVSEKFGTLLENKSKFKDESERMYLEAVQKYQKS